MKQTITNIRNILVALINNQVYNAKALSEILGLPNSEMIEALDILDAYKFIVFDVNGSKSELNHCIIEMNTRGKDLAEDMKNQERWDNVLRICDKMDDYSFGTVLKILEQLIDKEISSHIN